jgi:hypothetical protein
MVRRQPDISEEHITFIFTVEEYAKHEASRGRREAEEGGGIFSEMSVLSPKYTAMKLRKRQFSESRLLESRIH